MTDNNKTNQLLEKLEILLQRQEDFSREINQLKIEIERLKSMEVKPADKPVVEKETPLSAPQFEVKQEKETAPVQTFQTQKTENRSAYPTQKAPATPKIKSDIEKFIGENLINKIGIVILVIGVSIGAKYSIEHNLISPLTRIILGYLFGIGLLGTGMKLKKRYETFSAVLVSGAMAIMYFITYSAYSFYNLIPQIPAFALMVMFTAFTVLAAITYNMQVIAHIGLVGAYAVPFLLSEGSSKVAILFSYISLINLGILVISFKRYWKPILYSSFGLSWVIFLSWYAINYNTSNYFGLALMFLTIFFTTFYLAFLAYKLLQKEKFEVTDIMLLLANSFLFFGIGYNILARHDTGMHLLGLFTLCNAIVHFMVSTIIYRQKLADRNLFYLVTGLVLVFITIAIPVQLNGNWVTLLWAGEAALLFWIGRTKNVPFYEILSHPLMLLAFISIIQDWATLYNTYYFEDHGTKIVPVFNINFLSSLLFVAAFGFINYLNFNKKYTLAIKTGKGYVTMVSYIIPGILLISIYYTFRMEIENYWQQLFQNSGISTKTEEQYHQYWNFDLLKFKTLWIINYSLLFVSALSWVNFKKIRNAPLGAVSLGLCTLAILIFVTQGLYELSELRESYLDQNGSQYYPIGVFHIGIRYVSYLFVTLTLITCYHYTRQDFIRQKFNMGIDFMLHIAVLWILSSELINCLDMAQSTQSYKLGLSILWGVYSLLLIVLGIWRKKKYLRIGAIALFGIALIKLFFYDLSQLDTIAKTVVFISLGVLLLIISFLYHKYKHFISNEIKD
ncbi:MAG TPA: DUF2339 domain-containing protein [Bacteroidales bacterium]